MRKRSMPIGCHGAGGDEPAIQADSVFSGFKEGLLAFLERNAFIKNYGFAIPNETAIKTIAGKAMEVAGVVEIGAGLGYWASLIAKQGIEVVAYDGYPVGEDQSSNRYWPEPRRPHYPILHGWAADAGRHPDKVLLLCWPPYEQPMALEAARAHRHAGGRFLAFVGEGKGQATADDGFYAFLDQECELLERVDIPQFPKMYDDLRIYAYNRT